MIERLASAEVSEGSATASTAAAGVSGGWRSEASGPGGSGVGCMSSETGVSEAMAEGCGVASAGASAAAAAAEGSAAGVVGLSEAATALVLDLGVVLRPDLTTRLLGGIALGFGWERRWKRREEEKD